ncbi:hypothetical protein [Lutibacter flavus]|uniref:hypothetical protein n=1 Tax=Lutibacter flavus TaxID=691689 RepID=UPI001131E628|nr:hypothetical protein [Lutibacter flavus]
MKKYLNLNNIVFNTSNFNLKTILNKSIIILILLSITSCFSQEWKNLKAYQNETGNTVLKDGCWLKKDRKKQTIIWKNANVFNLINNEFKKYKTIDQIRDFYLFTQQEISLKGHEVNWIHAASTIATRFSIIEKDFIRIFIIRNKEVIKFTDEGSKEVFEFSFPKLKELYFSKEILKGSIADTWDQKQAKKEQCIILEPIYKKLSKKALKKLERMAKGKGIFSLGVSKKIRFEGEIHDCNSRYNYTINKLIPYCGSI